MNEPIWITGVGTIGSCGQDLEEVAATLAGDRAPSVEVDQSEGFHRAGAATRGLLLGKVSTMPYLSPIVSRRMSPPSRFAVIAARRALERAGLELPETNDPDAAVAISTTFGPSSFTQRLLDQIMEDSPAAASPMLFAECVANAAPARVAIHCKTGGPNHAISEREAGPLIAVGRAMRMIRAGKAQRALAGGVEEMTPLMHALLDRFNSLARSSSGELEGPRPFAGDRNGFMVAEGCTLLHLESQALAEKRRATPLGYLRSAISGFDPSAGAASWGRGAAQLARTLARGLAREGIELASIDAVVSGASGAWAGDRLEAETLAELWGAEAIPPLVAPKAWVGEYSAAQLVAALVALQGKPFGQFPGADQTDSAFPVRLQHGEWPELPRRILVSSLASSGAAAWMILDRP